MSETYSTLVESKEKNNIILKYSEKNYLKADTNLYYIFDYWIILKNRLSEWVNISGQEKFTSIPE